MTGNDILQIILYFGLLWLLAKPLGAYMARVYEDRSSGLDRVLGPLERLFYRLCGIRQEEEMNWKKYAAVGARLQRRRPVPYVPVPASCRPCSPEPAKVSRRCPPDSAFNTAVSFVTNTNWQGYGGETTMSYLTQMVGADRAELRVRGDRHGRAGRLDPGLQAAFGGDHRQLLGRSHAITLYILLPLSWFSRCCSFPRESCRPSANTRRSSLTQPSPTITRRQTRTATPIKDEKGNPVTEKADDEGTGDSARPRRFPDRDQAARHERRRVFQRQFGASFREPDAVLEFPRAAGDPR